MEDVEPLQRSERDVPAATSWATTFPKGTEPLADRIRIRITREDFERFRDHLVRDDGYEYAGYLLAGTHRYLDRGEEVLEYLVHTTGCLPPYTYAEHRQGYVSIPHETTNDIIMAAAPATRRVEESVILFAHSHPWQAEPRYSTLDNDSEPIHIATFNGDRRGPHGTLVFGEEGALTGRVWPTDPSLIREGSAALATPIDEVVLLGKRSVDRVSPTDSRHPIEETTEYEDAMRERQALLHGDVGNAALRESHVAVVGAGGLGALVVQNITHLGVGRLTVVDPDVVEESNRSRIVDARPEDAGNEDATPADDDVVPAKWSTMIAELGKPKVEVLERYVKHVDPDIVYKGILEVAEHKSAMTELLKADMVVLATDTQLSRRIVSHACKQYHRPLVNLGTAIDTEGTLSIASRANISGVGRPCLDCLGIINDDRLIREQHGEDPEAYGIGGPQPAVITVNAEAAQRGSWIVHRYLTGLLKDRCGFRTGALQLAGNDFVDQSGDPEDDCVFCGKNALFTGAGDRGPKPWNELTRSEPVGLEKEESSRESENRGTLLDRVQQWFSLSNWGYFVSK